MADENSYTGLIAGAHKGKERFTEWIYQLTQPLVEAQKTLIDGYKVFDLDLAEGEQLDALGVRIGVTRKLKIKIADVFLPLMTLTARVSILASGRRQGMTGLVSRSCLTKCTDRYLRRRWR